MKLIVGNLKMNLLKDDILNYLKDFKGQSFSNVIFCPSAIYLDYFITRGFKVGSQDVSFHINGAYTGDISASQLRSLGVNYSIIGHSERRKYHQDDKYINEKLTCALNEEIVPILCIGEDLEEKNNNLTGNRLRQDIDNAFQNISSELLKNVIIAYEPLWAIGTGVIPTNGEIHDIIAFIKNYVSKNYNIEIKVLYGGSVNNENITTLESIDNIDGYLVGGASLDTNKFIDLINKINHI